MPPTSSILLRLLSAAGYRIDPRPLGVVAVRVRDRRAVVLSGTNRSPAELESLLPPDAVHRTVIYDDEPGPELRARAGERGIEVLDPSTLGPALGELLLPSALAPVAGMNPPPGLDRPFEILPTGGRIVRARLGRAEAELLPGVDPDRLSLRLVPFYVAPYRVRVAVNAGEPGPVLDRTIAVHGVNGRAEVWDLADRELVSDLAEPHQFVATEVGGPQATGIAVDEIRRQHSVRVDHTEQHGGALVIETRRISPSPDDIRLGPLQLVYVPHWYSESSTGRIVVDAVTGLRTS